MDLDKNNKPSEEGYSVFDAGELDFILSNPLIRDIFQELDRGTEDNASGDTSTDKK